MVQNLFFPNRNTLPGGESREARSGIGGDSSASPVRGFPSSGGKARSGDEGGEMPQAHPLPARQEGELLIRLRYKVVGVLFVQEEYALLEAVDIAERERPGCLLNLYEGKLLSRYGQVFSEIRQKDCPSFRCMFLEKRTLVAVFDKCGGVSIDYVFHRGDNWQWRDRLYFTEKLLHKALELCPLPPELGCALMLSENLYIDAGERSVKLRFMVRPLEGMNGRELAILASDQVMKILRKGFFSTDAEDAFLESLAKGKYYGIVPLYSAWHEAEEKIRMSREEYEGYSIFRKAFVFLKRLYKYLAGSGRR